MRTLVLDPPPPEVEELLGPYADDADLVTMGPFDLGDGPDSFRVPDVGYVRQLDPDEFYLPTAAVVVEVLSPGDETYEKLPYYAAHDVDEVLVVDPDPRQVHIFRRVGDGYEPAERSALLSVDAIELGDALRWA